MPQTDLSVHARSDGTLAQAARTAGSAADPGAGDERDAGTVGEVDVARGVQQHEVGARSRRSSTPTSSRSSAWAPPYVAACTASAGVIPISRTARAMQSGTELV